LGNDPGYDRAENGYNQYFTKVGEVSDFWYVWRAYARHTYQKSGLFKMFFELLTINSRIAQTEENMRTRLLISFLIAVVLTAAGSTPQTTLDNVAPEQIIRPLTSQSTFMLLPALIETSGLTITSNSKASPGCLAPKGLHGPTAPFKIDVLGIKKANVNINGTSRNGNYVIYCSLTVKQGLPVTLELMWGNYVYLVARGTKTSRGSFFINASDKATMRVYKDKIKIGPFP
jgi:hypothetical protein